MDVDRLLLVSKLKECSILANTYRKLFFNFETKSSLSTSVSIFSIISQILKTKFYVFWAQTCRKSKNQKYVKFLY